MADSLMGPATGLVNSKLALADAGAENVLSGKKFYAGDKVIKTGSMPNNGAWSSTIDPGQTVQVPGGYHTGGGTVRAGSVSGLLKRTTIVKTCNPGANNFTFTGGTLVGLASAGSPGVGVNSTQSTWANGNTYGAQLAFGDSYGIQFVLVYY